MKYDFDEPVERHNTNSLKYDFAAERGKPADILPLWVADMDFRAPAEVIAALQEKAAHGVFGYSEPKEEYFAALRGWFSKRHGWEIEPQNVVLTCGVVHAVCAFIRTLTREGDAVLICQPVYYPFQESIVENNRRLVVSRLVNTDGFYTVDYDDFERQIVENEVKLFILCSPHNPVGRVWTGEELSRMGEICHRHGVFVVSDEIHADFVYEGRHTVFSTVNPVWKQSCAVCTAPSKTFNLAGLHNANIYIPNDKVRAAFKAELNRQGYSQSNVMGIVACQAAYAYGEEWLDQLLAYLKGNLQFLRDYLARELPQIRFTPPQGTYLAWLDCSALGLTDRQLKELVVHKAGLWLDDGYIFGQGGSGFQRVNFACPRATLRLALERLKAAVDSIR